MTPNQQKQLQKHLLAFGVAPALPIPDAYAKKAKNIYSKHDGITGLSGRLFEKIPGYDIRFVNAKLTHFHETILPFDHFFSGNTYQNELRKHIQFNRDQNGFYKEKTR